MRACFKRAPYLSLISHGRRSHSNISSLFKLGPNACFRYRSAHESSPSCLYFPCWQQEDLYFTASDAFKYIERNSFLVTVNHLLANEEDSQRPDKYVIVRIQTFIKVIIYYPSFLSPLSLIILCFFFSISWLYFFSLSTFLPLSLKQIYFALCVLFFASLFSFSFCFCFVFIPIKRGLLPGLLRSFGLGGPASSMVIIDIAMTSVAVALVINRVIVRLVTSKKLASDDFVIIGSLIICVAMNVINVVAVNHGYGRPSFDVPEDDLKIALELYFALQMLYRVTINMTKLSILLLYRKIFDTERFRFKLICDVLFVYIMLYTVATFIVTIFQCDPIPKAWARDLPGTCVNLTAFWYANAALHTLTDVIILLLPMPVIKGLKLPRRQKLALNLVFALGILYEFLYLTLCENQG
ncbi:integral membrane protein, putative [Trichophyton benhamiae CBS 112371]|uniref:Integral membrane protein, putative n=1 Tax=Arthroderma benhamiae (strain ATCC MYA-4681 / CBS 112371) TaxID=663331 RepID=D4B417_ARTBC|nr:integral membrane protein, putative [Trichophyton benhamiae CBS 112371]EFE29865.1 integral membrane protein, putative [Trichophyton benhamiae CBS 112371]